MSDLITRAELFAESAHSGQVRKDGKPYIEHPLAVADILAKNGASDELIAAGLLHDTIEDAGVGENELRELFGENVVRFILFDTENKSLTWEQRKNATLNALKHCDRECAMLVCADKLSNIRDVADGLKTKGEAVWNGFKKGKDKQEWLYREYLSALLPVSDLKMYEELKKRVNSVFKKENVYSMKTRVEVNNNLTFAYIDGNINSANAHELESALVSAPGNTDGVVIDAADLDYISSAGLRVLLSIKKRCTNKEFRIVGVNPEVMNIFDVTGFSEIMDIEPACREISVKGCEVIGRGACGECYRIDDETIIKLYYGDADISFIEHEKSLSKKAFVMGIPTAISYDVVKSDGRYGVVYELINSKTLAELIREDQSKTDLYVSMYADVCKKIHSIHTSDSEIPSFKDNNREDIKNITGITDEEKNYLFKFIDIIPQADTCIHGDLNINNIMVQDGECCLIDMGELSYGTPMFDISRILFSMVYANKPAGEFNDFYKMPSERVSEVYNKFFKEYFGCDTLEEAEKTNPQVKWLLPLAQFRCCTSFLKGNRWGEEMRKKALGLLREELIPFIIGEEQNNEQ